MTKSNGVIAEAPVTRSRSRQLRNNTKSDTLPSPSSSLTASESTSQAALSKKARKRKSKMAEQDVDNGALSSFITVTPSSVNDRKHDSSTMMANGTSSHTSLPYSALSSLSVKERADLQQTEDAEKERGRLTLWRSPFRTLTYFFLECLCLFKDYGARCIRSSVLIPLAVIIVVVSTACYAEGRHQSYLRYTEKKILLCLYWMGLGVLSSIGLGTGLHTFILYLGPHIASVTLAAYECATLNFPEPPYPDEIVCPAGPTNDDFHVTLWSIMSKVRLESFMWGLGTAIGELPPYFMARAARLSGKESEELLELQALLEHKNENHRLTLMQKAKVFMEQLVAKVGFFGILLGASIPNPLFDLAGITCGHFLVPFGTFFGATLLGKAVIKMHIQMIFVIITFSERHVEHLLKFFSRIPKLGPYLKGPFGELLEKQKRNLHRKPGADVHHSDPSWLQFLFEKFVICMVIYFVLSIVHSLAQNYHRRLHTVQKDEKRR